MSPRSPAGLTPRFAVVGPVNMDLFIRGVAPLDRAALAEWVGPSRVDLVVGGSVGYTAGVLARLGGHVTLATTLGSDAFGAHIRRELEAAGIDTSCVATAAGDTAMAIYMLLFGSSKRPMTYRLPGFQPWPDPPLAILDADGPGPDLVHAGGLLHFPTMYHRGLASTFAEARRRGLRTSIDPQFPLLDTPAPWLPLLDDVLAEADIVLCDEGEARRTYACHDLDEVIDAAHAAGPSMVVIKRGPAGSLVSDGTRVVAQPAIAVAPKQVRESVGAGDAYDAGFLDALVRGADVAAAARFATAAAALSLRGRGGAESISGRAAVEAVLSEVPRATVTPRRSK